MPGSDLADNHPHQIGAIEPGDDGAAPDDAPLAHHDNAIARFQNIFQPVADQDDAGPAIL